MGKFALTLMASMIAMGLGACSGDDGRDGAQGPVGPVGPEGPSAPVSDLPTLLFKDDRTVLSEPMLQNPTADSVKVVWFTEYQGEQHRVRYGDNYAQSADATTMKMSRMYEDASSVVSGRTYAGVLERDVWRHEATISGLAAGQKRPYVAVSVHNGETRRSGEYELQPLPAVGQTTRFLLTSDLQLKKMAGANYQQVAERFGPIDGVLFAGDLINVPNRASEWFDSAGANAPSFFASLQGQLNKWQPTAQYPGGELLQNAWLFPIIGNHEVMGRNLPESGNLNARFNDSQPRWYAEIAYEKQKAEVNPSNDAAVREQWIADHSYETVSYEEMFTLPEGPDGERYYAQRIGDTFLIALDGNRIWRSWSPNIKGKFTEALADMNKPENWGFGDHHFWPFGAGSTQHDWLKTVLASDDFKSAKYKVVMVHQSIFGLGDNATPVMAQNVMSLDVANEDGSRSIVGPFTFPIAPDVWNAQIQPLIDAGRIRYVKYDYPLEQDLWKRDVEPLLVDAGVQLVHVGHSHLWNRAKVGNLHYIETSNVGNSYGAAWEGFYSRAQPSWVESTAAHTSFTWDLLNYPALGDPQGREIIGPTIANPMADLLGTQPYPFVSSNDVTAFSILDTSTGVVSSYAFDTRYPGREAYKFDEFSLQPPVAAATNL